MPPVVIAIIEAILPVILEELLKAGKIGTAQEVAAHYGIDFAEFLGKLTVEYSYPGDPKPEQSKSNIDR